MTLDSPDLLTPLSRPTSRGANETSLSPAPPRTLFSRQEPVRASPDQDSPEPWMTPGVSVTDVLNTPGARRLITGGIDRSSSFARTTGQRQRRSLAMMGSLSGTSTRDLRAPRRPPPVSTEAWGNEVEEDDERGAGTPYMPQRPRPSTTAGATQSPLAAGRRVRQLQHEYPADSFLGRNQRADALFGLRASLSNEQSKRTATGRLDATAGTWATASYNTITSPYRTPATSPKRREQAEIAQAASFSSPRSPSRLIDDKLVEEDLL